ncbi:hypothetical protein J2747_002211 [Thermococcus stetteri]|nr:hypothetical protein [Thermococcus stetteri]
MEVKIPHKTYIETVVKNIQPSLEPLFERLGLNTNPTPSD